MNTDTDGDALVGWRKWLTVAGMVAIVVLFGLVLVGCGGDGKDGAPGAAGPQGPQGPAGEERYVSITNPANGQVITVALATEGDASPIDFDLTINTANGDNSAAGTRREETVAGEPAP